MINQALLHTDGGSRGNPGPSGIGFTIEVDDGRGLETICDGGAFIGHGTNNQAEYLALIWGLQNALELGVQKIDIHADSELMVKQINGQYKVKNEALKPLFLQVNQLLAKFSAYQIGHVFRDSNSEADLLANQAMDQKASVGNYHFEFSKTSDSLFDEQDVASTTKLSQNQESETGVYTLTVSDHFDAAHALIGYPGECQNLHGHTWDIEVSIQGTQLDSVGIVYDFKDIKRDLGTIIKNYDHKYLNEVPPFDNINATAENLARIIYEQLETSLPPGITLVEVIVWESPIAKLSYRKS